MYEPQCDKESGVSKTKIPWTEYTTNPYPGCRKVSPGCLHCYAERMAPRLKAMGHPAYQDVVDERGWTGKVGSNPYCMRIPGKHKMVFVNSMGDLFYEGINDVQIETVWQDMAAQLHHVFQVLTKRPERMRNIVRRMRLGRDAPPYTLGSHETLNPPVLPNVWLGVTVCNPDELWKIGVLLQIPAAVRFVSFEPLLADIDVSPYLEHFIHARDGLRHSKAGVGPWKYPFLDWCIIGPETGPGARPCSLDWIDHIVSQCQAANLPVFVKAIRVKDQIITDINHISNMLGRPPARLRQYPERSGK